ncbi:hypothetical protein OIU34_23600 [Pararhizobium sp. BT-229]|uniref:hypothetical protein n=1 Tax=Pararhizobium sp. BT-229 TaxID=2986923 RepID=UPI0021F6AE41|nr:hypothetical protein [Pararhizobium sp. BT-229]MCV9964882.1 hypothetical protein [Pararhizobium sp. BT-229]
MRHFWPNFNDLSVEEIEAYILRSRWCFGIMLGIEILVFALAMLGHINIYWALNSFVMGVFLGLNIALISYCKSRVWASIILALFAPPILMTLFPVPSLGSILLSYFILYLVNQTRATFAYSSRRVAKKFPISSSDGNMRA